MSERVRNMGEDRGKMWERKMREWEGNVQVKEKVEYHDL